jgi:hypothetical protein
MRITPKALQGTSCIGTGTSTVRTSLVIPRLADMDRTQQNYTSVLVLSSRHSFLYMDSRSIPKFETLDI